MKTHQFNYCTLTACLIFLLTVTISCTTEIDNDLSDYELSGNIEKVMIAEFEPIERFGEVEIETPIQFSVLTFNQHGLFSQSEYYDDEGELNSSIKYFHTDDGTQHTHHHIYRNGDDIHRVVEYTYNEIGKVSVLDILDADGELSIKYVLEYDELGDLAEESLYHDDGSLWIRWIYDTNIEENLTTISRYDSDGESMGTSVYSFNERDELISVLSKDEETTEEHEHIERDQNDNWTKKLVSENGEPTKIIHRSITYSNGTITGEYEMINDLIK